MRIIICGDTVPTDVSATYFEKGDTGILFNDVLPLFAEADRVVVNLECALTNNDNPIKKCGPNLKASPLCAGTIRNAGITDCSLSNNHVLDFGEEGLNDTIDALKSVGLHYTGIGKNEADARKCHIIEEKGIRVAIVSVAEHEYTYALPDRAGVWPFDPFDTMEDITNASKQADYTVVLYHGGNEQCRYPSPRLRKACRAMVRAGANVVLCQHSHCIGCMEEYKESYILYGQGNFHFVKYIDHPHWLEGLIVQLDFEEGLKFKVIPVVVKEPGIALAHGEDGQRIMREFEERNRILLDDTGWIEGWREFCSVVGKNYARGIGKAFEGHDPATPGEAFPHYLDCEAHTDVLREIYKTWHHQNK